MRLPNQYNSFNRNIAGAIRVGAGRDSIQSGLQSSLTSRNHELDDLFQAKSLMLKEKKKKKKDDSESDDSEDELTEDDGSTYVEKVGVSNFLIII